MLSRSEVCKIAEHWIHGYGGGRYSVEVDSSAFTQCIDITIIDKRLGRRLRRRIFPEDNSRHDIELMLHGMVEDLTENTLTTMSSYYFDYTGGYKKTPVRSVPPIKDVIFNKPATIVFWDDDTKTVVKCQEGDTFDPEKGLAMAIAKKLFGNKGNYNNQLKKWLPKEEE